MITINFVMKLIQFLINCVGFFVMFIHIKLSCTLVKIPDCNHVYQSLKNIIISLIPESVFFLSVITFINFFIERKYIKNRQMKYFIIYLLIQTLLLLISELYFVYINYEKFSCK